MYVMAYSSHPLQSKAVILHGIIAYSKARVHYILSYNSTEQENTSTTGWLTSLDQGVDYGK